jgi:hypothetical protein
VTAGQGIRADLVNVVATGTEALDHALEALAGVGRPDRLTIGVVTRRMRGMVEALQY